MSKSIKDHRPGSQNYLLIQAIMDAADQVAEGHLVEGFQLLQDQVVLLHALLEQQGHKLTPWIKKQVDDKGDTPQYLIDKVNRTAAAQRVADARALKESYLETLKELRHTEFKEKGGCEKCNGRGWVVVWDTLDAMDGSYHESGACPNPLCNAKDTGPNHAVKTKYDRLHYVDPELVQNAEEREAIDLIDKEIKNAERALQVSTGEIEDVKKGDTVEAFKGRKVPQGTVGEVFWIGDRGYGLRVGIKDEGGTTYWTALKNVRIIRRKDEQEDSDG